VVNQARVRHNDFSSLDPPPLGRWSARLSVSMVIPAWQCQDKLEMVLAGLAAQTYPAHLLEVVVVDDGNDPAIRLPEIRPERTRIVPSASGGWGRAHACHTGASVSDGDVIHWLDSDMLLFADHVEAQLRWHHVADYLVVLGYKRFVDNQPRTLRPQDVYEAVSERRADQLFDAEQSTPHEWVERIIDQTDGLRSAAYEAFRVHVGATASLSRGLYEAAGGMDTALVLGEDYEFGYRLSQAGAVFVPEPSARSWHLGRPSVVTVGEQVRRYNQPFIVDRVSQPRWRRQTTGRAWSVPYVDVVIDASSGTYEQVAAACDRALGGSVSDVSVSLVGAWSGLTDERRSPIDDPLLDLRLLRADYRGEGRVRFVERLPTTSAPAAFRLTLPVGWAPDTHTLRVITKLAEDRDCGLVTLSGPEAAETRLERTAALSRALAVQKLGESLDEAVAAVSDVCETTAAAIRLSRVDESGKISPSEGTPPGPQKKAGRARWRAHVPRLRRLVRRLARRLRI
jgi:GT2 family glycosyltransferase